MSREEFPIKGSQACEPVSLDDLFYLPRRTEDNWGFKPITEEQFLEVLEGMGAKRVWWCDPIWGTDAETHCTPNDAYHLTRCGRHLVLPLPTPQEET